MSIARGGPITAATIVDELMATYKVTIPIFIRRKMMCVGCPVAHLHDIGEACREHGIAPADFLADVHAAIAGKT